MYCENCGENEAEYIVRKIENGKETVYHFCDKCTQIENAKQKTESLDLSIQKLLGVSICKNEKTDDIKCSSCGLTFGNFRDIGKLGCSQCYYDFDELLEPILRKLHGTVTHRGKHPKRLYTQLIHDKIQKLREELTVSVKKEQFEKAASIRDEIRSLSEGIE